MLARTGYGRVGDAVLAKRRIFVVIISVLTTLSCGGDSRTSPIAPSTSDAIPPTTGTLTVTGFVRETAPTDNVPVADARVDIIDPATGSLTGQFVMTDAGGAYRFPGLAGSITFRASKEGYEGDSDRIHLAQTLTLDFNLTPNSRKPPRDTLVLGQTQTGTFGVDPYVTCAGKFFTRPCKRFVLAVTSSAATLQARLEWSGSHDLDLELWRDDTLVVASLICQACGQGISEETFTTTLPPGEYEVRAVLFEGVGPTTFKLTVSQAH
jgi:hypothetical protein